MTEQIVKIRGLRLHPGQKNLLNLIKKYPEKKYWTLRTPRQWGKTTFLLNEALRLCISEPGTQLWFVTPFFKQSANIFKTKLLPAISPIDKNIFEYVNRGSYEIKFTNGSYWQFQSAENPESLRTATLDYLIGDEVAFWRPKVFEEVISPMLIRRGKRCYFASTPKGKNDFYEYDRRGIYGDEKYNEEWASYRGTYEEIGNQKIIEEVQKKKLVLPEDVYRQEYEAEFIDGGGQVFKNLKNVFTLKDFAEPTYKNYVGIDLGMEHDRTVVTILNSNGEVVYFKRYEVSEQQNGFDLVNSLYEDITSIPNVTGWVEKNFNPAIAVELHKKYNKIFLKTMSHQYKTKMIDRMNLLMSKNYIKSPDIKDLRVELENFEIKFTEKRQNISYGAPSGGHDDCVISIGLACMAMYNDQYKKIDKE